MIESALISSVLFVRWRTRCEPADVARIMQATEYAHRSVGVQLVYVASIPIGVPPPDATTRAALREGTEHASGHCSSMHLVIEGHGLRRAIIRSVSAGLLLATRASFSIHTDIEQALHSARAHVSLEVSELLAKAKAQGVAA